MQLMNHAINSENLSKPSASSDSVSEHTGDLPQQFLEAYFAQTPFPESQTLRRILYDRGVRDAVELDTALKGLIPANQLLGLSDALALMDTAIDQQQSILIVGDFDADGATSTTLMMRVLGDMGAQVNYLVPDRFKFGYGLTPAIVDLGIELYQPQLIITVDNGISSHEGVAHAQAHDIKVIITDHHLTSQPKPAAEAVVNPNQLGCEFPSKALAGVGVAFYILASLAKQRRQAGKSTTQVTKHLDLVALGTVADVSVMDANNRILVANGLQLINNRECCAGFLALLEQAGKVNKQITSQDLGFILGPRINAAGRMDSMRIGIQCLLADNLEDARELAKELESLNQQRRHVEGDIREQALQMLEETDLGNDISPDKKSIVLYEPSWHQGVVGIVAGRLKERFYRPAIVFAPSSQNIENTKQNIENNTKQSSEKSSDNTQCSLKGSARSIASIHIRDAIEAVAQAHPDLITHFGGHAMAAGLTLEPEHVDAFSEAFEAVIAEQPDELFTAKTETDGTPATSEYHTDFAAYIQQMLPWGNGFTLPQFTDTFTVTGHKLLKEKHLKLFLKHPNGMGTLEALYFNFPTSDWQAHATEVEITFTLDVNEFRGQKRLQLLVNQMHILA